MKPTALFACSLLFIAAPASAALDPNSCASRSMQMKPDERDAYLKSCLEQASSPANVKEIEQRQKMAQCEQNAKNHRLDSDAKGNYISSCMNSNEAAAAAKGISTPATEATHSAEEKSAAAKPAPKKAASRSGKPAGAKRNGKSCEQQAKESGLKGDKYRRFVNHCKQG